MGKNNTLGDSREPPVQDVFWRQPRHEKSCKVSMPGAKAAPLQGPTPLRRPSQMNDLASRLSKLGVNLLFLPLMKTEAPALPGRKRSGPRLSPISAVITFIFLCPLAVRSEQSNAPVMEPEVRQAFDTGLAKFQAGQFQEAKQAFARVTELLPNYSGGWINLGSAEYRLDQLDDAEKHLRKAVHLDPDVTQAWLTLGIIAFRKGELEAGLAALSQAVYLEPDNAHAHMYLGVLVRKRGWLDAAEDELRKAVELDENYAEAHFNLAMVYMELKPPAIELARRHYYRALALGAAPDPDMDRVLKQTPVTP